MDSLANGWEIRSSTYCLRRLGITGKYERDTGDHGHLETWRTSFAEIRRFYPRALASTTLPAGLRSAPSLSCDLVRTCGGGEERRGKRAYFTISDGFSGILVGGGLWQGVLRHTSWSRPDAVRGI